VKKKNITELKPERSYSLMIKSELHLNAVLTLMRKAQKEARRLPSKGNAATARYWEGIVDQYLASGEKENCRTVVRLTEAAR
jgi:hypothetical protein